LLALGYYQYSLRAKDAGSFISGKNGEAEQIQRSMDAGSGTNGMH
jgi:hypothetical protein